MGAAGSEADRRNGAASYGRTGVPRMNKRLLKRHKRQVSRANKRVKLSEPDVRTPEELKAAREASRPAGGWRGGASSLYSTPSIRNQAGPAADSRAKGDA